MTSFTRRTALHFAALGLSGAVAGCAGARDDGADSQPTGGRTPTSTGPPTTTPHWVNDCGFQLRAERADDADVHDAERILSFENLSAERKREFELALSNGTASLTGGVEPFEKGTTTVVEYEDEQYASVVIPC